MQTSIHPSNTITPDLELLTFRIGNMLMGIDIHHVKEINCHLQVTRAPHSDEYVLGVMNLRSDVITVLDFGKLLRLGSCRHAAQSVIVNHDGELVALAVDRVEDVITMAPSDIAPLPPNFRHQDQRAFRGVYRLEAELVLLLDLATILPAHAH